MALKTTYADATQIPENLASFYTESADGRFVLDIDDIDNHPKVRGVINANNENKRKAQERLQLVEDLQGKLSALPEDFDADEWQLLKSNAKPDEQVNALREQHNKALAQLKAQHKASLDAVQAQISERDGFIDSQTRNSALNTALDEVGFDPIHKPLVTNYLAEKIKVRRDEDGSRVAFAETDFGEVSALDFVRDFAAKQGAAYLSTASGPGGSGSTKGPRVSGAGDLGGDRSERVKALANRFPDLPKR